jgi:hypothetical protein
MTSLHQRLNQENVHARESAVEGLHSRWSSSTQVVVDRLPSQPLSPRRQRQRGGRLQGSDSKWTSGSGVITDSPPMKPRCRRENAVEGIHSRWRSSTQVVADKLPSQPLSPLQRRRGSAGGRLQGSYSKWTSGSGVITDSPPLKPRSRRRSAVGRLEQSGSRWSSGSQAAFDTASSQALAQPRMIVRSSSVPALEHSATIKKHDVSETTIRALYILNLSRMHLLLMASRTGTARDWIASPSA